MTIGDRLWPAYGSAAFGVIGAFFAPWNALAGHTAAMWLLRHIGAAAVVFAIVFYVCKYPWTQNIPEDKLPYVSLALIVVGAAAAWANAWVIQAVFGLPLAGL